MIAFLVAAQLATSTPCLSVQPSPVWICHNGGWLPPGHPLLPVAPPAPVCDPLPNPYLEPEQAAICSAWIDAHNPPAPGTPTFQVGRTYRDPYDAFRVVVLTVTRSLEGVPVVTVQRIAPVAGQVFSFRTNEIEAQRWALQP